MFRQSPAQCPVNVKNVPSTVPPSYIIVHDLRKFDDLPVVKQQ